MRILIVDDSKIARMTLKRILGQAGLADAEVLEASNGEEALEQVERQSPELILSDWNMPRKTMTGLQLLEELRARGSDVKFGFVTCEAAGELRARALRAGAEFFITKPISAEALRAAMNETQAA